jgi:DNA-binding LytR/AlgR family response regulator
MKTTFRKPHKRHETLLASAPRNIIRLEANVNYTTFVLETGKRKVMSYTIGVYNEVLPKQFVRLSKSVIVNADFVKKVDSEQKMIVLNDGTEHLVSRRRWDFVNQSLGQVA